MPHVAYLGPIALRSALRTPHFPRSYNLHLPAALRTLGGVPGIAIGYHILGCRELVFGNGVGLAYLLFAFPNSLPAYEEELPHLLQRPAAAAQRQDCVIRVEPVSQIVVFCGHEPILPHIPVQCQVERQNRHN